MTAVANAIPAEALRKRQGHSGRAICAADQAGRHRAVPLAEDAVGDIAQKGEAGDQHDHQPQALRIPRAERAIVAVGKERQHRAGDHRVTRERLHVVVVELVEQAVKLGLQREDEGDDCRARNREPGLAEACHESQGRCRHRRHRRRCVGLVGKTGPVRVANRQYRGHAGDQRARHERLSEICDQSA
jgi:hypothetical protein